MCGFCGVTRREYIFGGDNIYVYVYVRAWNWLNSSSIARRSTPPNVFLLTMLGVYLRERDKEREREKKLKTNNKHNYIFFSLRETKFSIQTLSISVLDNFDT